MRHVRSFFLALWVAVQSGVVQAGSEVSVQSLPPVVVETIPRAGDTEVDPATSEVRVTFSKDMMTEEMWSWVIHTKESFPEVVGEVRYLADGRTCVAPVKLEAGRSYAIWFNSPTGTHSAFRDRANNPAIPYLLVFETAD